MEKPTFEGSKPVLRSNLRIFDMAPTDTSVISSMYGSYGPVSNLADSWGGIRFYIPKVNEYMDLSSSFLYIRARIRNQDGTALAADENVACSSSFFHTMFSNLNIKMNGITISDSANLYPYRGAIPEILCRGEGQKNSVMCSTLFYPDDIVDDFTANNKNFIKRRKICEKSQIFDFYGRPAAPIFETSRYLPNGVDLNLEFLRSKTKFCVDSSVISKTGVTGDPYDCVIEAMTFYIKYHGVNPDVEARHGLQFKSQTAKFPLRELECHSTQISAGALSFSSDSYFYKMPSYLILGLVSATAKAGAFNKNPLNFKNYSLSSVNVKCENSLVLSRRIDCNFKNANYMLCYQSILDALGTNLSLGNGLDRSSYINGNNLFLFSLAPTNVGPEFVMEQTGKVKVCNSIE